MRRLFKKYKLLVWLVLLLSLGVICGSAVLLKMSSDLLAQQSAETTLPAIGETLVSEIGIGIATARSLAEHDAGAGSLRGPLSDEERDSQKLIAHLKAAQQQDNSLAHFLVTGSDRKYVDSQGSVRTLNPGSEQDVWYLKALASSHPYEFGLLADNPVQIVVTRRLSDSGPQNAGVTGISISPDTFIRAMHQYTENGKHDVYVVNSLGNIVFGDTRSNRSGNLHQQPGLSAIADALLSNHFDVQNSTYEQAGVRHLLNVRYLPELDLYLIVEQNAAQNSPAVWPLVYANGAIGILVMTLALLITGFTITGYQKRLRILAGKDNMTGLLNRQSFTRSFQQTALEMQRLKLPLSFILFDIDFLKKINDAHGHSNGDKIIREIARLSQRSVRGSDLICRWGGEQFALLLRRCELEQAYKIAEQLRLNVQNHSFAFADRQASVTISLGVAQWTENETMDELFARVDVAVFLAKSEGRNRAEISYHAHA